MFQQWRLKRWCLIRFKNKRFDLIANVLTEGKHWKFWKLFLTTLTVDVSLCWRQPTFFQTVITGALCYLCMSFIQCVEGYVVTLKDFDYYPYIVIASVCLSVCLSVCPSVCPSIMLSPPKPLEEIQPNVVYELLTWMRRATAIFFGPAPWGPGEGSKSQISFNFNYKVNFKDVYTKLCVCSHKWKIQNISDWILILMPGSCPRGGTKGRWGCSGVLFFSNIVMCHIKSTGMTSRTECK